jgi:hypothetical protein
MSRLLFAVLFLSSFASASCQSTFSSHNYLQVSWCVNQNGEIEQLANFANSNQVIAEGYAVCTATGEYWSVGGQDSGNWNPPIITQTKGPNTVPLTITRTSSDGLVTIEQTFTWPGSKAVQITTKIIRIAAGRGMLIRYVELDPLQTESTRTLSTATGGRDGLYATVMRASNSSATSSLTNGGLRNLCSGQPDNSNQALELRWGVRDQQVFRPYLLYSTLF